MPKNAAEVQHTRNGQELRRAGNMRTEEVKEMRRGKRELEKREGKEKGCLLRPKSQVSSQWKIQEVF